VKVQPGLAVIVGAAAFCAVVYGLYRGAAGDYTVRAGCKGDGVGIDRKTRGNAVR